MGLITLDVTLAAVGTAVFYFVARAAVRDGVLAAWQMREAQRRQAAQESDH
jgi:hypothetical protein